MDVFTRLAALLIAILLAIDALVGGRSEALRVERHSRVVHWHHADDYRLHFSGGRTESCKVGLKAFDTLGDGDVVSVDTSRVFKSCEGIRRGGEVIVRAGMFKWLVLAPTAFLLAAAAGWIRFEGRERDLAGNATGGSAGSAAMGYDFILFRLRQPVAPCPARIPADFGKDSVVPIDDAAPLHAAIGASPVFDPGTVTFEGTRFVWHTPDGGTLDVNTIAQGINIDTHAHWDHVAELFDVVLAVWPDTALFDLQKAHVHDPPSFRAFVERSYRDKAEWDARRAAEKAAEQAAKESADDDDGDAGG